MDLGDKVKQGELMAKIYDKTFRDQLNQAEAQLAQSLIALRRDSAQFERQRQLLDRELVSESDSLPWPPTETAWLRLNQPEHH